MLSVCRSALVAALPQCPIKPILDPSVALLQPRFDTHPLGCHRPHLPDPVAFGKLVVIPVL